MTDHPEPPRLEEAVLLTILDEFTDAGRVLCTSFGRGQFAAALASRSPATRVHLSLLDVYQTELAQRACGDARPNLAIACEADFPTAPGSPYDSAALCVSRTGEAELVRDRLQAAYLALRPDGRLVASIDYADDKWLLGEMEALCGRVERRLVEVTDAVSDDDEASVDDETGDRVLASQAGSRRPSGRGQAGKPRPKQGVIYVGRRGADPKKIRDFRNEFAFRDEGRLVRAVSRPGVFAHRRLDLGARKILDAMEVSPGEHVVDIGCGSGALACAAALRGDNIVVRAIDSNARAVESTLAGARLNGLTNVTADLSANGLLSDAGTFTLALANPPYYSGFKLARVFLDAANRALAPGGRLLLVTQFPEWYLSNTGSWFDDVQIVEAKKYSIVSGRKR